MNVKEKLEVFSETAMREAEDRRQAVLKQVKKELDERFNNEESAMKRKAEEKLRRETGALSQQFNKEVIDVTSDIKKDLIRERLQFTEKIFENVHRRIEEFRKTKEYENMLTGDIEKVREEYGSAVRIFLSPEDSELADKISLRLGLSVTAEGKSFLGGFRALIEERKISIDKTVASALEGAREGFNHLKI